jgi:hypothetical protein
MATLTGQQIDGSYQGLLKTTDNGAVTGASKAITDGLGNATNIEIGNAVTKFPSGTVDFTGSTVQGLPSGSAGLESGTGTDSMQSASSLTTNAANASATDSIALGNGAAATKTGIAIGKDATNNSSQGITIGNGAETGSLDEGMAIGLNADCNANAGGIAIGRDSECNGNSTTAIGRGSLATNTGAVALGWNAKEQAASGSGVAIGFDAQANNPDAVAIGLSTRANADNAVALGNGVTAATADTVSVKSLETQADGGVNIKGDGTNAGKLKLYCEDASGAHNVTLEGPAHAGGASYSLKLPNVQSAGTQILEADSSGNLSWINTPSGGGGSAGLVTGGQTNSMKSAAALTTNAAVTNHVGDISIGENAQSITTAGTNLYSDGGAIAIGVGATVDKVEDYNFANTKGGIAIGTGARADAKVNDGGGMAIGSDAESRGEGSIAIGTDSLVTANTGMAIGYSADAASSAVALGKNAQATAGWTIAIGESANASAGGFRNGSIAIGSNVGASVADSIAIGNEASATADSAVALGHNVTAATANTVSVSALEVQTDSTPTAGGIIISDAGGTDRRLNIDSSGNLQVDSAAVGAAPMVSLPRTTGNSSSGCDVIYSSVLIPANTFAAGDILQLSGAMSASGSANTIWSAYWISTNGTVGGSATEEVNMGQLSLSQADWAIGFQKNLYVNVADGTGTGTELVSGMAYTDVDGTVNTSGISTYTPDWTSNLYLVNRTCIQASNTGVAYVDHGAVLKKIN